MAKKNRTRGRRRNRNTRYTSEPIFASDTIEPVAPALSQETSEEMDQASQRRILPMGAGFEEPDLQYPTGGFSLELFDTQPEPNLQLSPSSPRDPALGPAQNSWSMSTSLAVETKVLNAQREIAAHMGYLNRQVSDLEALNLRRSHQSRRETWLLAGGISMVLLFCFAAFYMNQVEVKDLQVSLKQEIKDRTEINTARLGRSLHHLHTKSLPDLRIALEDKLLELDSGNQTKIAALKEELSEIKEQNESNTTLVDASSQKQLQSLDQLSEELQSLMTQVKELKKATEVHHISQLDEKKAPLLLQDP